MTNAHVIAEAIEDKRLTIGIIPPEGGDAVYARIVSVSPRNDLALLRTTTAMNLPPLTIAGNPPSGAGEVTAIGYPANVDLAQGLQESDIFRAQPPVTSTGFLSGRRPSREFDTLLHTAPIARGNSGGPLVDNCGRLVGVNSFGAESGGAEAEFFFAITTRELLPFLRANNVTPRLNSTPCRSLADLDAQDAARAEQVRLAAEADTARAEAALARQMEAERRAVTYEVTQERSNAMALTFVLLLITAGAAGTAGYAHTQGNFRLRAIAGSAALVGAVLAGVTWFTQPAMAEIDARVAEAMRAARQEQPTGVLTPPMAEAGPQNYVCVLDTERSRVVGAPEQDVPFTWDESGCVNDRTQYGLAAGRWTRVFVPASEAAVSVNRFDPDAREYVVERYLLDRNAMARRPHRTRRLQCARLWRRCW